jgi:glyoxylase-like metal-dependent hydrolase (beta-lactamase superfamily II)
MRRVALALSFLVLGGCTTEPKGPPPTVERMYVIDCGESHVKDLSRWTPSFNIGTPYVFSNHCYLIKHTAGWMLWETGHADALAALPGGQTMAGGKLTAFLKKPLVESLKEIGVSPADIKHMAMSHAHGDHSGNANLFHASTVYMQAREFDAMFGSTPQKFGFVAANFDRLKGAKLVRLNGDHDVFGDGNVLIKSAPGHTPGHQVLVVRLPKTGPVMLSGDMVHLLQSWEKRLASSLDFDPRQSLRTIDAMKAYARETGAKLWVNHDREQQASIPKAPAFVD